MTTTPTTVLPAASGNLLQVIEKVPLALSEEQRRIVAQKLQELDFNTMSQLDISRIGSEANTALAKVLDAFLERIDKADDPRLLVLFNKLQQDVDEAKLDELADRILDGKLSFGERVKSFLSKEAAQKVAEKAREELTTLVKTSVGTLKGKMDQSAAELNKKMATLQDDMNSLESLKQAYRERLGDFTVASACAYAFAELARGTVAQAEEEFERTVNPGPGQLEQIDTLRNKLQTAQSCAVAIEGTLTRLPADQLVISQIQQSGVMTYIETLITQTTRFNSIKMTLLTLHGALGVKNVQDLNAAGAALDANLAKVRGKLVREVVHTAANAPGDNRIVQANQIKAIVEETKNIQEIVNTARTSNKQKFATARAMFAQSRREMVELAKQIQSEPSF